MCVCPMKGYAIYVHIVARKLPLSLPAFGCLSVPLFWGLEGGAHRPLSCSNSSLGGKSWFFLPLTDLHCLGYLFLCGSVIVYANTSPSNEHEFVRNGYHSHSHNVYSLVIPAEQWQNNSLKAIGVQDIFHLLLSLSWISLKCDPMEMQPHTHTH